MAQKHIANPLEDARLLELLKTAPAAVFSTAGEDGFPYSVPMNFVFAQDVVYLHGKLRGQKMDNIRREARVSLAVYDTQGFLLHPDGRPCGTTTLYRSVLLQGTAHIVEDFSQKETALRLIVEKYTPQLRDAPISDARMNGTAVICIDNLRLTGKCCE